MYVMNAIGELFTYVYNKKKKERERQEQEHRNFDQSITDNSQSSHTLVDDKQPQNQGYNNEALMEFLKQQQDKINNRQQSFSHTLPITHSHQQDGDFNLNNNSKENRYDIQSNNNNSSSISNSSKFKFNTLPPPLPLPPPRAESNCSNYSNYSSANLNSHYDSSSHFKTSNNCPSELSLATQNSCSEMQQMQNVITSARKANDMMKGWQMFENGANDEFGSNSLISEKDENDDNSIADENWKDNWANFDGGAKLDDLEPPDYPPPYLPPLYLSNEDLSITTTATTTATNSQPIHDLNLNKIKLAKQSNHQSNSLNNSQNSTSSMAFVVRLDTPPASARRRSKRLSESSMMSDKQKIDLNETKRRQSNQLTTTITAAVTSLNQFETNFNQKTNNEFQDKANNRLEDNNNNRRSQSLSKEFDLTRDVNSGYSSRNASRSSNQLKENTTQFNHSFDNQQPPPQQQQKFDNNFQLTSNVQQLNSFDTLNSDTNLSNENNSPIMEISTSINYGKLNQYSSIDSAVSTNRNTNNNNAQLNRRLSFGSSLSDKKSSLDLNEFNQIHDSNDKYAVFNDINSLKFSIFSNDGESITEKYIEEEDEHLFSTNKENGKNQLQQKQIIASSSLNNNKEQNLQSFEDSFLADSSLNQSESNNNSNTSNIMPQQSHQKDNLDNSINSSLYGSITVTTVTDPEILECHKKFLKERQEKLDQIDKIFDKEKYKLHQRQRELNAHHLKQQKNLLNQQKSYQQEFYQRQKHQRQTILHKLQLQRLQVTQFDQCKLQLQQKLKNDQKQLQNEFIRKQQELKKLQIEEQNQLIHQYKILEEQYLEKQSELLNSDFEIEIELPQVPNIFDDDSLIQSEQALTKQFELNLKNEFDKLTNEIIQTTSSSLNSSPKLSERCSTACSIASSSSRHNPFFMSIDDDDDAKLERSIFEDFDKALNLIDNNRQFDYYSSFGGGSNESSLKEQSIEYFKNDLSKSLNNERLSNACCSLDTNRSTSTLPATGNFNLNHPKLVTADNNSIIQLNKSLNNEPFKKPLSLNQISVFRSQQQLSNSLPKNYQNMNSFTNQSPQQQLRSSLLSNNPQKPNFVDPFNCSFVDTKLSEMNRIKELRQHTQQQLLLEETNNQSFNSQSLNIQPFNQASNNQETSIKELEDLLGLSTSSLNKDNSTKSSTMSTGLNSTSLNASLNTNLNQFKLSASAASQANNSKMFDNLFDLKKNNSLVNFTNSEFQRSIKLNNNSVSNNNNNLFANDFKKNSLSFQDLRRTRENTDQFKNNLQKNQTILLNLQQQKNNLDVFGTVVVGDLNNKNSAKQLFNHFGTEHLSAQERNIFTTSKDPFKGDDFFNN